MIYRFGLALTFLLRVPWPPSQVICTRDLLSCLPCFPLVGFVLGGLLLGAHALLSFIGFGTHTVAAGLVAIGVLLTGNIHLDGLVDTADGWGGKDIQSRLVIMRDSRVGAHGLVAGSLLLLTKYALILDLSDTIVLLLFPVCGRRAAVYGACIYQCAREGPGLARAFVDGAGPMHLLGASVLVLAICGLVFLISGELMVVMATGLVFLLTPLICGLLARSLGGVTGDTLGALVELTEVVALAGFSLAG